MDYRQCGTVEIVSAVPEGTPAHGVSWSDMKIHPDKIIVTVHANGQVTIHAEGVKAKTDGSRSKVEVSSHINNDDTAPQYVIDAVARARAVAAFAFPKAAGA